MSSAPKPPPDGDVNIGYQLTGVVIVTFGLAAIAVTMRMYARARLVRKVGWDDWLILFAVLLGLIASVTELIGVYYGGLGRHSFYLTPAQRMEASMYRVTSQAFCTMALCFIKLSICVSLLRIIQGAGASWTRYALWGTVILQFVVNTAVTLCLFVQCQPTQKIWNQTLPGSCWNPAVLVKLSQLQGVVSVFSDWSLSLIPFWIIQNLQLDKKNRFILCFLMGLGIITGVFAIVRTAYLLPYFNEKDPTFTNVTLLIWSGLERNIACIVACVPSSRPLVKEFLRLVSQTSSRYRSRRTGCSAQSDQHELSKVRQRSAFGSGVKDSIDHSQVEHHAGSMQPTTRSEESILPLHNRSSIHEIG